MPAALTSATYDPANQIATWGSTSFSYDLNGNLTSDGTKSFTWNARNQLTGLSGGVSASFQYDGVGRRRAKTVNGTSRGFLYDGENMVQELTGGSPSANILSGLAVDEWLTRTDSDGTRHFLVDALGSTVALADGAGAVLSEYTVEPFGETTASGFSSNASQFTGRENDGDGLYYYRARYYAASMARFVSEDPLGERAGVNSYAYVGDRPTAYIDPHGLLQLCCRPVNMPGLRQMGARHCFLKLSDGGTLGGYNRFPRLVPERDNPDDKCPKNTPECRELPGSEPDVRRAWDSMPKSYRIYGIHGSSNAIPFEVLDRAGIPYTVPDGAWGGRPVPFIIDMPTYIP